MGAPLPSADPQVTATSTYLVVADDPALLERLRALAEGEGVTVLATADALEARRLAATAFPEVVLTAEPGPGVGWLRTLPQQWTELPAGAAPALPAGVRAFAVAGAS